VITLRLVAQIKMMMIMKNTELNLEFMQPELDLIILVIIIGLNLVLMLKLGFPFQRKRRLLCGYDLMNEAQK